MSSRTKILILSCSTGEGHNSAANAISAKLDLMGIHNEIVDVLTFRGERARKTITGGYNTLIRKMPSVFGLMYHLGGIYDATRLPSPIYSWNAKYADAIYDYIRDNGITCVICAHLFAMEAMTALKRKFNTSIKCYGVLTDYTAVPFYKDTELDGYFVPDETVRRQLVKKGIPSEKLFITGIPVHPKFNTAYTKQEAREKLNLPADKKIIAVMTGGAGCGKIGKLCKKFDRVLDENHLVIVFVGRNEKLKASLDKQFAGNEKFMTVAFTSEINVYLKAADVAVSKAGGLSSTEIAVSNVPLVHLKAIPGLETANVKFFSKHGLSLSAGSLKQAVKKTVYLLSDNQCRDTMRNLQRYFINASATQDLTNILTEETKNDDIFMDIVHCGWISYGQYNVLRDNSEISFA